MRSPTTSSVTSGEILRCVPSATLVKFVIGGEFDNKTGAIVKHQIPRKIPGSKDNLHGLAELMIPLHTEKKLSEDYTIFILYKNSQNKYGLFPDSDKEVYGMGMHALNMHDIDTIYEMTQGIGDPNKNCEETVDEILFVLNVCKAIASETDERGMKIRSIAIVTPMRNFLIFKHIITIVIQSYVTDGSISHLVTLFNVINSIDTSIWQRFISSNHQLHNNLSLGYEFNNRLILQSFQNITSNDISTQSVKYKSGVLQYYPSFETNDTTLSQLKSIPLNFPLDVSGHDLLTDRNLDSQILSFLSQLSSKLNAVKYKNFNILVFSNQASCDALCQFIISLSNFLNGFDNAYFSNDKILFFPLVDISSWDNLQRFDEHSKNMKIIGTNNIVIKENEEFYDFCFDLDASILKMSPRLEEYVQPQVLDKTHNFQTLVQKLQDQKHDSQTVLLSLKRFNMWQILTILNRKIGISEDDETELNMKDYYLSENKNVVVFNEFFEFKTIELIEKIDQFLNVTSDMSALTSHEVSSICSIFNYFIHFVSTDTQNSAKFLFILEIFPDNGPDNLIFDIKDMRTSTSSSLINSIFRTISLRDSELQSLIVKLFLILNKSTLKLILENRLNPFVKLMLEESCQSKNLNPSKRVVFSQLKKSKTGFINTKNVY